MHPTEIIMFGVTGVMLILGLVAGIKIPAAGATKIRRIVLAGVLAFVAVMLAAVGAVHLGSTDTVRVIIFWMMIATVQPSVFGVGVSAIWLFRSGLRRRGFGLLLLSLVPIPVFIILGTMSKRIAMAS